MAFQTFDREEVIKTFNRNKLAVIVHSRSLGQDQEETKGDRGVKPLHARIRRITVLLFPVIPSLVVA